MRNPIFQLLVSLLLPLILISSASGSTDFSMLPAIHYQNPTKKVLLDITRTDSRLLAVGEQGIIVFSDDEGRNWQQANVPVSVTITAIYFSSPAHGWAVGHQGIILYSHDGGKNWQQQFSGRDAYQQAKNMVHKKSEQLQAQIANSAEESERTSLQYQLEDLQFSLKDIEKALNNGPSEPLFDIWFRNAKEGLAVGAYGLILTTNDGGQHWQLHPQYLNNLDKFHFYAINEQDNGNLFLAGESGTLWRSNDKGESWQSLSAPYEGSLFGITTSKDGALLTYGLRSNIYRSEDNGNSWQRIVTDNDTALLGAYIADSGSIFLVGVSGAILNSQDNGQSFQTHSLASRIALSSVLALNENTLLLVGKHGLEHYTLRAE